MDTGTSLLAGPSDVVRAVAAIAANGNVESFGVAYRWLLLPRV